MKKLLLLCVLLLVSCISEPEPTPVVEVPVTQPDEGYLVVEYIDLKLENEKLIQELYNANAKIGELTDEVDYAWEKYGERRDRVHHYKRISLYLLNYLPENQREIIFCDGWNGIVVRFLDTNRLDNCLDIDKLIDYISVIYPYYYPTFWQTPVYETPLTPCTAFCDNEIIEQEQRPEP